MCGGKVHTVYHTYTITRSCSLVIQLPVGLNLQAPIPHQKLTDRGHGYNYQTGGTGEQTGGTGEQTGGTGEQTGGTGEQTGNMAELAGVWVDWPEV